MTTPDARRPNPSPAHPTATSSLPPAAPDPGQITEATSLHQQGRIGEAIERYQGLLAVHPELHAIWMLLGMACLQTGQMDGAVHALERSVLLHPANPIARASLGNALQALGRHAQAIEQFDRALILAPDHLDALFNRGVSLDAIERPDAALESYRAVLARQPMHPGALNNGGEALRKLGRHGEARAVFDAAINLYPDHIDLRLNRGTTAFEAGDASAALADFDALLARVPDHAVALNNSGNVLHAIGAHAQALARFDRALAVQPAYVRAWLNRANTLQALMRLDEAQAAYEQARRLAPDSPEVQWNASHLALLRAQYASGWRDYEARWQTGARFDTRRHTTLPRWLGDTDLHGKRILLWHEQGLGDTIQFCRYAMLVAARGAHIVLEVQAPLKRLIAASLPQIEVIATGEDVGPCDAAIPLMSLPFAFGTDASSIPEAQAYLTADPVTVRRWETRLAARERGPRIGLAFSGNATHNNDRHRSIPAEYFTSLSEVADLYVIQKDVREQDAQTLSAHPAIRYPGTELGDFADTAALIAALDLVVTVDTSVAHLAGALGKPVWVLLPTLPDWRWELERKDTPWYRSAQLIRLPRDGGWPAVIAGVRERLSRFGTTA
ncbi:Tetratricopeptide repeat protein [Pararobbsia alpina]|uniref:tetratricopeptide repeat protein n=1 Tax=Pararobbsia alpina TaxID=621374 RepID=UPI0039A4AF72